MIEQRSALGIQRAVVNSLFLREMKTRFGVHKFGYLWAILEPAAFVGIFWVIFGFRMKRTMPGVDFPIFILVGIIPWLMFLNTIKRSMNAFNANQGLFNYRQVKPIDTIIARVIVELLVLFIVLILLMIAGHFLGFRVEIDNIPGFGLILFEFIIFSFGLGLLCAVIGNFSNNFQKIVTLIMRPLYFSSGIFYAVEIIPEKFRWMILLNPVIHFIEFFYSYYFSAFNSPYADHYYILFWTVIPLLAGLWLYDKLRIQIITS